MNQFTKIVDVIHHLNIDELFEIQNIVGHNLAELRREEFLISYEEAKKEGKNGKLKFSSDIKVLRKQLRG